MTGLVILDHGAMRAAVAARRRELGISQLELDHRIGWADGYTAKIECGMKNCAGRSMGELLQALGLVLVPVRADSTYFPNFASDAKGYAVLLAKPNPSAGGRMRAAKMSKAERVAAARKAIGVRWAGKRVGSRGHMPTTGRGTAGGDPASAYQSTSVGEVIEPNGRLKSCQAQSQRNETVADS